jgi:hypothetical protein
MAKCAKGGRSMGGAKKSGPKASPKAMVTKGGKAQYGAPIKPSAGK